MSNIQLQTYQTCKETKNMIIAKRKIIKKTMNPKTKTLQLAEKNYKNKSHLSA